MRTKTFYPARPKRDNAPATDTGMPPDNTWWETPRWLFDQLDRVFNFNLDAAAAAHNAHCDRYIDVATDGLVTPWTTPGGLRTRAFCNPPYGRQLGRWVARMHDQALQGALVVGLILSNTDTAWWHDHVMKANAIWFFRGRIAFCYHGVPHANNRYVNALVLWDGPELRQRPPSIYTLNAKAAADPTATPPPHPPVAPS